ncbi:MAG: TIGR02221 family CRISPR-associated protein [Thermoplasmata archaeon]
MAEEKKERILLTTLGDIKKLMETSYILNNRTERSEITSLALIKLLEDEKKPDEVIALATSVASGTYALLEKSLENTGIRCRKVDIPNGGSEQEITQILNTVLNEVPENAILTLDLTHGLRHLPFLFYSAALYLTAFKNVEIQGIWYGSRETPDSAGNAPFIDLKAIFDMAEWFYAVRNFIEKYDVVSLAEQFEKLAKTKHDTNKCAGAQADNDIQKLRGTVQTIGKKLRETGLDYNAGLPIELGIDLKGLLNILGKNSNDGSQWEKIQVPLGKELIGRVITSAQEVFLPEVFKGLKDDKIKSKLGEEITEEEIKREAALIDNYLKNNRIKESVGLMRELIITRVMLCLKEKGKKVLWLNYYDKEDMIGRKSVEEWLNKLQAILMPGDKEDKNRTKKPEENREKNLSAMVTECQKKLARVWAQCSEIRNSLAHHGMKNETVKIVKIKENIASLWKEIKDLLNKKECWDIEFGGGSGKYLITSLGLSKGLLYSALVCLKPARCYIITSESAKSAIHEICTKAGYRVPDERNILVMKDPHTGFGSPEVREFIERLRWEMLPADEVYCNMTGGTTAMQFVVTQLYLEAEKLGRTVKTVAFVDRRSMEDQKANPYVLGEMIELPLTEDEPEEGV